MVAITKTLSDEQADCIFRLTPAQSRPKMATFTVMDDWQWQVMRLRYPVVRRFVGGERFKQLIDSYIEKKKSAKKVDVSSTSDKRHINRLGGDFGQFLEALDDPSVHPMLADLASFEWMVQQLPVPQTPKTTVWRKIKQIFTPHEQLQVRLCENSQPLISEHGLVETWISHHPAFQAARHARAKLSRYWLIARDEKGISATPVNRQEFQFYRQIQSNTSIGALKRKFSWKLIERMLPSMMHNRIARIC